MVRIPCAVYLELRSHGESTYPEECCGILLGETAEGGRIVHQAIAVENSAKIERQSRYAIAPVDLVRIMLEGRRSSLEVIGFYHSHPDHPADWSKTDLAEAHWLGCSYLITSIVKGYAAETISFELAGESEDAKLFEAELVIIF